MKKIILPFFAFFIVIVLSTLDASAQRIQMRETPDYVGQNGQSYVTTFLLSDLNVAPEIPPPSVSILGDDFVDMKATSCRFLSTEESGFLYELHLQIEAAVDFGDAVNSHVQLTFDLSYDRYCQVDFWMVQAGLSVGSITPSSQNILFQKVPQKLTYSSSDISSIRSIQWQQKVSSGNWVSIPGATGYSYSPGSLSETTEFRVVATSKGSDQGYTASVIVNVSAPFLPGEISGAQTIAPGYYPAPITSVKPASGGSGPITYQWQSSVDNKTWADIPGATSDAYQSQQALTVATYFRRRAKSGPEINYSNTAVIWIKAPLSEDLSFQPVADMVSEENRDTRTKGLKTYEKVAALGDGITPVFVERAFYYDYKGRVIQTVEKNHLGGISRYSNRYDFVGNVLKSHEQHTTNGSSHQKLTEFTYDKRSRLRTEKTTLDNSDPVTVTYTYDQLGRLNGKTSFSGTTPGSDPGIGTMDRLAVGTNIRGWTFQVIQAGLGPDLPVDAVRSMYLNGQEWISLYHNDGDNVNLSCYSSATVENLGGIYDGGWGIPEGYKFTIKNDRDYIVTSNDLPSSAETGWGFDRVVKVESGTAAQVITESYSYNIQGWQTNKTAMQGSEELFTMNLRYYDPQQPDSKRSYTGNISEWSWRRGSDSEQHTYAFTYDKLSRLTDTRQYIDGVANDRFVERGLSYDRNGNIQALQRYANGALSDNFTYTYSGNRLASISGTTSGSYAYDANGNMTQDGPNNLDLAYNSLNLTEKVTKSGATIAKYSYLSDGTKLAAVNADGNGLVYRGSLVYKKQGNDLMLESVAFNGGRLVTTVIQGRKFYVPNYYLTDHLGSVRVVVDVTGKVLERNDFYPFGMRWAVSSSRLSANRHRYNGKEEQGFLGLPYTDYGARQYDPKYRLEWNGMDKLAEMTPGITPFAFCNNNPTRFVDHFGLSAQDTIDVNHIEPVVITATRSTSTLNSLAYYALPMVSFNDDAEQAATDRRWGAYVGNIALGALDGIFFIASLGNSSKVTGPLKIAAKTATRAALTRTLRLSPQSLDHIIRGHWATSKIAGKSKFLNGMNEQKLVEMIKTTVERGVETANTNGRAGNIYIYDFKTVIGNTSAGSQTSRLKVVINNNEIITAYPYF